MRGQKFNNAFKRRNSKNEKLESELSFSNRATRLVLVLTIMGTILGVVLKVFFSFFVSFFSSSIYLELYIRWEHILILCIGSYIISIVLHLILYVIAEFQSFNIKPTEHLNNQIKLQESMKRYDEIFKALYIYLIIGIVIFAIYSSVEGIYFKNRIFIFISILFIVVIVSAVLSMKFFKRKNFDWLSLLKRIPYKHVGVFLVGLFLWFILGLGFMYLEGPVDVKLENDMIVIESKMSVPRNVEITFIHKNSSNQMETVNNLKVIKEDFNVSYQETISSEKTENYFYTKLSQLPPNSRKSIQLRTLSIITCTKKIF